jgi:hypothetical protein
VAGHGEIAAVAQIGAGGIVWRAGDHRAVLVHPVGPPAAVDLVGILPIAGAAFAHDAIVDVLPVFQIPHVAGQLLQIDIAHFRLPLVFIQRFTDTRHGRGFPCGTAYIRCGGDRANKAALPCLRPPVFRGQNAGAQQNNPVRR